METLDLSQYDPSCEKALARKDFREKETRLGCIECLVRSHLEVEPTIIGLGVYCGLRLMNLPSELQCDIAQRLENEDVLNLRLTFCKGIANGIDYAFVGAAGISYLLDDVLIFGDRASGFSACGR